MKRKGRKKEGNRQVAVAAALVTYAMLNLSLQVCRVAGGGRIMCGLGYGGQGRGKFISTLYVPTYTL